MLGEKTHPPPYEALTLVKDPNEMKWNLPPYCTIKRSTQHKHTSKCVNTYVHDVPFTRS
jgi:hypothetical protein